MEFENSYLQEKERINLIEDFILHETKKFGSNIYDGNNIKIEERIGNDHAEIFLKFRKNINSDIEKAVEELKTYNLAHKWMLFHSISYGILNKELWNCVGWNELSWKKVLLTCFDFRFESKRGLLNEIGTDKPFFRAALEHAQTKPDTFLREQISNYAKDGPIERLSDPIICRKENKYYLIHDGTGRMIIYCCKIALKEIENSTEIISWMGEKRKSNTEEDGIYRIAQNNLFKKRNNKQAEG